MSVHKLAGTQKALLHRLPELISSAMVLHCFGGDQNFNEVHRCDRANRRTL